MKLRLPVYLDNLELPSDNNNINKDNKSYGYISVMYILSLIITISSVLVVIFLGK